MAGTFIDELFVKLGFVPDTSGIEKFKRSAEDATSTLLTIGSVVSGALAGIAVKAIATIGDEFEQNQIALAGFFDALKVSTGGFDNALADAGKTMDQIIRDAALLPGEADEYIEVFRAGLPVIKDAVPNESLENITAFTNKLTAISHTLKVPTEVAAREMQELFVKGEGHATRINILFKRFLPFLRQVEGQANLTQKSFNAMTAEQRVNLFRSSFAKLDPMLKASSESFDAMKGAIISAGKQLLRLGTSGVFKGMKEALSKLNALFYNTDGTVTATGQAVIDFGHKLSTMVVRAVSSMVALVSAVGRNRDAMNLLKGVVVTLGIALVGLAFERVARGVGMLLYSLMNLKRLLTGALFTAIYLVAEDLYVFETGGDSVTGMLVDRFGPAAKYISEIVLAALTAALVYVQRQAIGTAIALARPLLPLLALGGLLYLLVTRWKDFGEAGRAAVVFLGAVVGAVFLYMKRAAIQTAVGLALMNLPLIVIIGTLAALAALIFYAATQWDTFSAGAKTAIVVVATALGVLLAGFVATQAGSIAAAAASAAAWLVALGPIGLIIAAVGVLTVILYELVAHWDAVTDAISRMADKVTTLIPGLGAVKRLLKTMGIIKEETTDEKEKRLMLPAGGGVTAPGTDQRFDQPGAVQGAWQAPYTSTLPGAERDRGTMEGPASKPSDPGQVTAAAAMLGGGGGVSDTIQKALGQLPPGILSSLLQGGAGGQTSAGSTNVTNTQEFHFGDIKIDGAGKDSDAIARELDDKVRRQLGNLQGARKF